MPRASALILAGGRGTRFWPASRESRPKSLFSITGGSTLLSDTVARLKPLIAPERTFVMVATAHARVFRRGLSGLIPRANLIVEPAGRGTAVAIAYGAAVLRRRQGAGGLVAVIPADHYIHPAAAFRRTLGQALKLAALEPAIVVIGVKPTGPETGYGYQAIGNRVRNGFRVARFIEKPSLARAKKMAASGRFLWNAGMFVMGTATLEAELKAHCPGLADAATRLAAMVPRELAQAYCKLDYDSFDRAVVEKSSHVLGVRANFLWRDVGTWEGLWEAMGGRRGNVLVGQALAFDSRGVLAHSNSRLMVLLGVKNIVAVDTPDALLIMDRARSQEMRRVIQELERRGLNRYL